MKRMLWIFDLSLHERYKELPCPLPEPYSCFEFFKRIQDGPPLPIGTVVDFGIDNGSMIEFKVESIRFFPEEDLCLFALELGDTVEVEVETLFKFLDLHFTDTWDQVNVPVKGTT